jgi:hypothetical protein
LLVDTHIPSLGDVSMMVQRKHAFIDTVNGIEFDRNWDFEEVEAKPASLFPELFAWINHPSNSTISWMVKPKWMLLAKRCLKLTGATIADYTIASRSSFRERHLYLSKVYINYVCFFLNILSSYCLEDKNPYSEAVVQR